jgi:ATP-dependent DNA helicase RecQ
MIRKFMAMSRSRRVEVGPAPQPGFKDRGGKNWKVFNSWLSRRPLAAMEGELEATLQQRFGLTAFKPGQREVIERLIQGQGVAAIFPTGGGKSLCYQLPALLLDGMTLVVSPLLALMREQVESLQRRGIPAARLDSSLSSAELQAVNQGVKSGRIQILYVAPERFFNERFRELLRGVSIGLFAIDEAHCISQWGHNFRPDYLKLARIAHELSAGRILALTATATPAVIQDIQRGFGVTDDNVIQTPFHRRNLQLLFTATTPAARADDLDRRLRERPRGATIIYVTLQKTAEELAAKLVELGYASRAYHAGLADEERQLVQDWFMRETDAIVVATIAFGMGIDKADIRYIYHWNIAKGLENFAQEIGRAGRDGQPSVCESLVVPEDRMTLENFVYGDHPSQQGIAVLVDRLAHQPPDFFLSYYALSQETDIRETVIRTLMTYLELDGYLQAMGPRYDSYEFKPKASSSRILHAFSGDERRFVSDVLSLAVKKKIWFTLKVTVVMERLACERDRLIRLLEKLEGMGVLELKVSGLVHGYHRLKPMVDRTAIQGLLQERLSLLERQELERIDAMFALATSRHCQAASLSAHFGQPLKEACGQCSACRGQVVEQLPKALPARVGSSALTQLRSLIDHYPEVMADALTQAKFLCGIASPKLLRNRLTRHPLYGCCREVPFAQVLEAVDRHGR